MKNRTMRAVTAPVPGGPDALELITTPIPEPGPGEVRIACAGMGVNRPDVLQRQGLYPAPDGVTPVLGLEVSGLVDAIGPDVTQWARGDRVCALLGGGGYAEYAIASEGLVMPAPAGLSLRDAAGLPETVVTVWANVFERGALQPGETLLVHGGASGIGVMAIQMAAAFGARVIATAGTQAKCDLCLALGAERALVYRAVDFVSEVKDAGGADVILDMVGGPYVDRNLSVLKAGGRLVQIAFQQGSRVEVDLMRLMLKGLTLTGSVLRSRPVAEKARLCSEVRTQVWPWFDAQQVQPVIDSVFGLADVRDAHERLEGGDHQGKIVLIPEAD